MPTITGQRAFAHRLIERVAPWLAAIVIAATIAATALPAQAEISPSGESTWGVYGLDTDTETDTIASHVFAIEQIGNRIYVGGKFLEARPYATATGVPQPYLAAFDATTGAFISSFRPDLESAVYALQASPDGSRLFVGGEFTSVDGDAESRGLVALDPITGAVDTTWRAKLTNATGARGIANSLTIDGDQLYVAGRFDRVGGGPRPLHTTEKVTRVALSDGTADTTLSTDIDGGSVWGIAVAPNGSQIYLAGYHDAVDGNVDGADYSVLDATDGSLLPALSDIGGNSPSVFRRYGQDIVAVGDYVFWGGSEHIVRVIRASDGTVVREHSTDRGGDFQDLEVVGDRVYASCHCYTNHFADFDYWPNRLDPIPPNVQTNPIKYVAAYSATTGEYLPTFSLDASATQAGVWALHGAADGCLWVGGDISRITTVAGVNRAAGGFAKFCEGDGGDVFVPTQPGAPTQTRAEDHKLVIRWEASTDNVGVANYEISRDGAAVATVLHTGMSHYWFVDTGLDAGTDYDYELVAVDGAGNRSSPATITATTTGVAPDAPPPAPTGLRSTLQTMDRIVLTWDTTPGATNYTIQRHDGTDFVDLATQTGRWYTNLGLNGGTTYTYRIIAIGDAGLTSAPSTELAVSTEGVSPDTPPPAPTGLRSTLQTRERIVLTWDATPGATSYAIQRHDGTDFVDLATQAGRWYTNLGLNGGTTYTYRIIAIGDAGLTSAPSTELPVATLP